MSQRASLASVADMVLTLNVNELRTILRDMGFSVEGGRDALQKRLIDSVSHSSSSGKAVKLLIIETVSLLYARKNAPGISTYENDTIEDTVEKSVHNIAKRYVDLAAIANQPPFKKPTDNNHISDARSTITSQQQTNYNTNVPVVYSPNQTHFNNYRMPIPVSPVLQTSNRIPQQSYIQPSDITQNCNTSNASLGSMQYRNMMMSRNPPQCSLPPSDNIGCMNPYGVLVGQTSANGSTMTIINPNVQISSSRPPTNNSGPSLSNSPFVCNKPPLFDPNTNHPPPLPLTTPPQHCQPQKQNIQHQQQLQPFPSMNKSNHVVPAKPIGTFTFYQSPFYMIEDYIHQFQVFPSLSVSEDTPQLSAPNGKRCLRSTIRFNLNRHANTMIQEYYVVGRSFWIVYWCSRRNNKSKSQLGSVAIHLRLFAFDVNDMTTLIEDSYPSKLAVCVNKRSVHIPGSFVNPDKEPRKPNIPLNISEYLKITPNYTNVINLEFVQQTPTTVFLCLVSTIIISTFYYALVVVRKIDPQYLVSNVLSRARFPMNLTKSLIKKQLFNNEKDLNIMEDGKCNKVSLLCPLSMTRIKIPIRHTNCQHFQCFDLESYICMNDHRPTWQCPVCDIKAYFHYVYVDGFFEEILRSLPPNVTHIVFNRDLTHTIADEPKTELQPKEKVSDSKSNGNKFEKDSPCLIIIDDDDDEPPVVTSKSIEKVSLEPPKEIAAKEKPKSMELPIEPSSVERNNNKRENEVTDPTKSVDNHRFDPNAVAKVIATHEQSSHSPRKNSSPLKSLPAHNELISNMPEALVNPSICSPDSEKSSTPKEGTCHPPKLNAVTNHINERDSSNSSDSEDSSTDSSETTSSDSEEYDVDDDDVIIID